MVGLTIITPADLPNPEIVKNLREELMRETEKVYKGYQPTEDEFLEALSEVYAQWQVRFDEPPVRRGESDA